MVMSSLHQWEYLILERGLLFGGEAQLVDDLDGNLASGHPVFLTAQQHQLSAGCCSDIPYPNHTYHHSNSIQQYPDTAKLRLHAYITAEKQFKVRRRKCRIITIRANIFHYNFNC
jgi:hypothetical protein